MDPFTQNMISRTKMRQQMLKSKPQEQKLPTSGGLESISSDSLASKKLDAVEPKTTPSFDGPKLKNLGKENQLDAHLSNAESLVIGADVPTSTKKKQSFKICTESPTRKNRLDALAGKINRWEDESVLSPKPIISTPENTKNDHQLSNKTTTTPSSGYLSRASKAMDFSPSRSKIASLTSSTIPSTIQERNLSGPKESTPTKAVESQGFTPSTSRSKLIYDFEKEQEEVVDEEASSWTYAAGTPMKNGQKSAANSPTVGSPSPTKPSRLSPKKTSATPKKNAESPSIAFGSRVASKPYAPKPSPTKKRVDMTPAKQDDGPSLSVLKRAAMFDSPRSPAKDPIEMSLSERKALFERNPGQTVTPKFTPSVSRQLGAGAPVTPGSSNRFGAVKTVWDQTLSAHKNASEAKADRMKELEALRNRHESKKSYVEPVASPSAKVNFIEAREKETPSSPSPSSPTAPRVIGSSLKNPVSALYPGIQDVKKIRVSPPKQGMLYPCLSDIEVTTENETDEEGEVDSNDSQEAPSLDVSQELDSSFTLDILGRAGLSQFINTPKRKIQEMTVSKDMIIRSIAEHQNYQTSDEDEDEIGDLLDEALENPAQPYESTPPKVQKVEFKMERKEESDAPLFHSVSSYRKQQQGFANTPIKQVVRNPEVRLVASNDNLFRSEEIPIQQQIRNLQEEITTQQNVIAQASQALNLCRATAEFSGSTEQVEGEKLLLVASQKRMSAMNEIQQLKTDAAMKKAQSTPVSRGTISMSNISLPLKKDFLSLLLKGGDDFLHYFIVLIKNKGQVIPLQMLSTADGVQDGALRFPNLVQLRDLPSNFEISFEVYALQTRKEKLEHDVKYHIRKESSRMRLTPKKLINKQDSRLLSKPIISSPAGPSAVRSSSFGLVGYMTITPAALRRQQWTLENVPGPSPIDGSMSMKIQCHTENLIEERGFLTVFEDVGGFGAWHRRWCLLSNDQLLFWKYPDDEKRKDPLSQINLRKCTTESVDAVSHDMCARPHTFLLVTVRQPQSDDKDSLVMTCYPQRTALRHLISADLKEERLLWCSQLNRALANLRAWDMEAQEPTREGSAIKKNP